VRPSIFCNDCGWIETRRNKTYVLHYLRCENRFSKRFKLVIFGLLFVVIETVLMNSGIIGLSNTIMGESIETVSPPTNPAPPVAQTDSDIKAIDSLLQKYQVESTRRGRVAEAIIRSSRKHKIDPRLVASILIVESRGNPFAISGRNAVGIMQIHVPTWGSVADEEGVNLFKIEDNVDLGVRILENYVKRYGQEEGIKRYTGWKQSNPGSVQNAEAYLHKVEQIYIPSTVSTPINSPASD
jgi:Transglycosylase SLT domain